MPQIVSDFGSNLEENIVRWAKKIKPGGAKYKVLRAIYTSQKRAWTVAELAKITTLTQKAASQAAKGLNDLLHRTKVDERLAYSKRPDVAAEKRTLFRLIGHPGEIAAIPTKRRPWVKSTNPQRTAFITGRAIFISIDDIDSFARVKKVDPDSVPSVLVPARLPESQYKKGIENILGERSRLKDWGGENLDLYSTNLILRRKRIRAGIALKGPAKSGPLTPGKMGANGDQIERLVSQPIDIALVQYEGDIAPSVHNLLEKLAREKARSEQRNIYYCTINLLDSYRLRIAYKKQFSS